MVNSAAPPPPCPSQGVFFRCLRKEGFALAAAAAGLAPVDVSGFSEQQCLAQNGTAVWAHATAQHFDNVGASIFTVLRISSLAGWGEIMTIAVDSPWEVGDAPARGNKPVMAM